MGTIVRTQHICYNCFVQRESSEGPCPCCGFDLADNIKKFPVALRAGTVLNNRYVVGRVLGQGGFGITYLAFDTQLQAKVAVKEYMPNDIATRIGGTTVSVAMETKSGDFAYGAERFQEEARTLAKFIGHPNIAGVSSYFDENDTSYFVMDYIEGVSFKNYIANQGGKASVEDTLNVMIPVLRALTAVHGEGFIHRDVTPDNIYISKDGNVKLLDFGSARYSIGDKSKSLDVILKVGYAPKEQYIRRGRQGPYTDVYSCAACFYAAMTGFLPPESLERLDHDELVPVSQCGIDIPEWLDKAILKGLAVQPEDRFQNAQEFLDAIENQIVVDVPAGGGQPSQAPEKKKVNPLAAAGVAAALVLVLALSLLGSRGGVPAGGNMGGGMRGEQLLKAEVPSITIRGQEYSTNEIHLDLSGQGLTDSDIQDLKYMINLRSIQLDSNNITDLSPLAGLTRLESIQANGNDITDVSPLAGLEQIRNLNLGDNPNLTDLSPLKGKTEMEDVYFYNTAVTDYGFYEGMTKLRNIQIYDLREEMDLSALSTLTGVESLSLQNGGNSQTAIPHLDLSFMAGMTGLRQVSISGQFESITLPDLSGLTELTEFRLNSYSDYFTGDISLEPMRNLTKLQILSFDARGCTETLDLSPLAGMTDLRNLQLGGIVSSLAPLKGLTKLQTLAIYHNGSSNYSALEDISGLAGMADLQELNLNLGNVGDLSPLSGLSNLTSLQLSGSYSAKDLNFLSGLTKLKSLNLNSNSLTLNSLEGMENLTQLQSASINSDALASLKGIENCTALRELNLYGSEAVFPDTAPLANLVNITTLSLPSRDYDSPPFDASGLSGMTKLQDLRIYGKVTSLEFLRGMSGLKSFDYSGGYAYDDAGVSLAPLAELTGLQSLSLNCNVPGSDITPLSNLTELRELSLYVGNYRNPIRSLEPLANLKKLTTLRVSSTADGIDTSPVSFVANLDIY